MHIRAQQVGREVILPQPWGELGDVGSRMLVHSLKYIDQVVVVAAGLPTLNRRGPSSDSRVSISISIDEAGSEQLESLVFGKQIGGLSASTRPRRDGLVSGVDVSCSALCGAPHKADYVDSVIMLSYRTIPFRRLVCGIM